MKAWIIACVLALAACAPDAPPAPPPPEPLAPTQTGGLTISDAWIAATPGGASRAAGYLTIVNGADAPDRLVALASPRALSVEAHEMILDGAIMKMREIEGGLVIPAGGTVTLAPEGLHLMFIDITAPFTAGETVPVQLTFEHAGLVSVSFPVRQRGAAPAGGHDGHR